MNILHLEADKYCKTTLEKLSSFKVDYFNCKDQQELYLKLLLNKYNTIFTRLGLLIDKKAIDSQPSLSYIVSSTTGLNHIDVEYAKLKGIEIISLKGEVIFLNSIKSTAEHTWALLMILIRNIIPIKESVNNGFWLRTPFLADELNTKSIGIIGFGRLGKIIASYAKAFGMKIFVNDILPIDADFKDAVISVTKDELLQQSDYVILLVNYSSENENLMSFNEFKQMKKGSYFINTSRGEMVDENALHHFLSNKHLKAAALDVLCNDSAWNEKIEGSEKLIEYAKKYDNLLITSHTGGFGKISVFLTRDFITDKFISKISA